MGRTLALLVGGVVMACAGVWSLGASHPDPASTRAVAADGPALPLPASPPVAPPSSEQPEPGHRSAPTARRARPAHPGRRPFSPTTVTFIDAHDPETAPVDPVGTSVDETLDLPPDPARMGWWTGGSQAGAPYGNVVLAGHLDSARFGVGFSALMAELDVGDEVELSDDDQALGYVVTDRFLQPRTSVAALASLFSDRGRPLLVLITCGGSYDSAAGAYSDNMVVLARPTQPPRPKHPVRAG
ncbi:class F sortase [Nocardioides sp. LHG3406-4]|uniref:class F sortase n=1 Tax=Nocardioides sp. LHG3406-4 TaxID=2804575 RepID=UPI003CF52537